MSQYCSKDQKHVDTDKGSREEFGRDIHKDVAYGAGYLMVGQGQPTKAVKQVTKQEIKNGGTLHQTS